MNDRAKMTKITTAVARHSSVLEGQETLFISASTEIKKSANRGTLTTRKATHSPSSTKATKTNGCALPDSDNSQPVFDNW